MEGWERADEQSGLRNRDGGFKVMDELPVRVASRLLDSAMPSNLAGAFGSRPFAFASLQEVEEEEKAEARGAGGREYGRGGRG